MPRRTQKQPQFELRVSLFWWNTDKQCNTKFLPYHHKIPPLENTTRRNALQFSQFGLLIVESTLETTEQQRKYVIAQWQGHGHGVLRVKTNLNTDRHLDHIVLLRMQTQQSQFSHRLFMLTTHASQLNAFSTAGHTTYQVNKRNSFMLTMKLLEYLGWMHEVDRNLDKVIQSYQDDVKRSTILNTVKQHISLFKSHFDIPFGHTISNTTPTKTPSKQTNTHTTPVPYQVKSTQTTLANLPLPSQDFMQHTLVQKNHVCIEKDSRITVPLHPSMHVPNKTNTTSTEVSTVKVQPDNLKEADYEEDWVEVSNPQSTICN